MAITYVGGQVGGRAGSTSTSNVTFSLTGGTNSTPQAGDLVIIGCTVASQARTPACAISGYTAQTQINANGTTYDTSLNVSYKFMGGTPDTTFTLPSTGNIADAQRWTVQVWRSVDSTTPLDVAMVSASGTATGRPNPGSITPSTSGAYVGIIGAGAAATGAAYTAPANYTTGFLTGTTADTNDAMIGSGYRSWTSGAEDPAAYTGGTTNAADSWAAFTYALRPAPPVTHATTGALTGQSSTVVGSAARLGPPLEAWFAALDDTIAATANSTILCIGDSLTAGCSSTGNQMGSNARSGSWPAVMAGLITNAPASAASWFGDANAPGDGKTLPQYDTRIAMGAGWAAQTANTTVGHYAEAQQGGNLNALTFTPGVEFDRIRVFYAAWNGSPEYTLNIGGGTIATLNMDRGTAEGSVYEDVSCPLGTNPINIVSTADWGAIAGAYVYKSSVKQVNIINGGWWGSASADWNANANNWQPIATIKAIAPNLSIIMLGGNDCLFGTSESTFKTNLGAVVDAALASGSVLLVGFTPVNPTTISEATQDTYIGYISDVSTTKGVSFLNMKLRTGWTSYAVANAAGYKDADGIHNTGTGYADVAAAILGEIEPAVTTHATSGALTGQIGSIAGSAAHVAVHGSTGALSGQIGSLAGSANRFRAHDTSGTPVGQGSAIVGAAARASGAVTHDTTGALTGQGSTAAGTAARFRAMATSGALVGPGAVVAGSANRHRAFASSGTLTGHGSEIVGSAYHQAAAGAHDSSGALVGQDSALSGSAARLRAFGSSGVLVGQGSAVSGAAQHNVSHASSGDLVGPGSSIAGTAVRSGTPVTHDVSGDLVGPGSAVSGIAQNGTGAPSQIFNLGLRAQLRKHETEEQKRLRREAQGIIQRIKEAEPQQVEQLQEEAEDISGQLRDAIAALENVAAQYQSKLNQKRTSELQSLLVEAQLQAEMMQQQQEELDVCYVMLLLAAHV